MNLPLRQYIALLAKYLKPHWRKVTLLCVLLAVNIGLQLANPQIVRRFIDTAQSPNSQPPITNSLITLAFLFAITAILGNLAAGLATYVSEDVAWAATNQMRSDLTQHTLALDMTFHKTHTAGEMIERIDGDVTALSNFFSQFVVRVFGTFVLMVGVLVVMYAEDWRIGLAMTVYAFLVFIVLSRTKDGEWETVWFEYHPDFDDLLVIKGSVAIDGVSLTVVNVERTKLSVMLIPHTLAHTTLGAKGVGDAVNLEFDLLAKHVQKMVRNLSITV